MTKRLLTIVVACGCATVVIAHAEQLTLPQLVKLSAPDPFLMERTLELVPVPIEQILPHADLIVHATVSRSATYLSDDQKELYTDYVVTPVRVMFERNRPTSIMQGVARPITLRQWGGTTTIDGISVLVVDLNLRPFDDGA